VVEPSADLLGTRCYEEGLFEIVGQADQVAARLAATSDRGSAIVLQAGPGAMHDAVLASSQANRDKLTVLTGDIGASLGAKKRARRLGSVMVRVIEVPPEGELDVERIGQADRVLVEVPSTGTGTMLQDPLARWKLEPTAPEELQVRQLLCLERAASLVAPRGRLVYISHSVLYRENQAVLGEFLGRHPEFGRFAVRHLHPALAEFETNEDFLQILPGQGQMYGLFAAVIERE
jgi:16S rRNA (cytosine967-C5)-methyltransferase